MNFLWYFSASKSSKGRLKMTNKADTVGIEKPNILEQMEIGEVKHFDVNTTEARQVKKLIPQYRYKQLTFKLVKLGNQLIVSRLPDKTIVGNYEMALFKCSNKAADLIVEGSDNRIDLEPPFDAVFPLYKMTIGQSFALPLIEPKYKRFTIENEIKKYCKRNEKQFKVIEHSKLGLFEVARIA
jgi:hypothetical protein